MLGLAYLIYIYVFYNLKLAKGLFIVLPAR